MRYKIFLMLLFITICFSIEEHVALTGGIFATINKNAEKTSLLLKNLLNRDVNISLYVVIKQNKTIHVNYDERYLYINKNEALIYLSFKANETKKIDIGGELADMKSYMGFINPIQVFPDYDNRDISNTNNISNLTNNSIIDNESNNINNKTSNETLNTTIENNNESNKTNILNNNKTNISNKDEGSNKEPASNDNVIYLFIFIIITLFIAILAKYVISLTRASKANKMIKGPPKPLQKPVKKPKKEAEKQKRTDADYIEEFFEE